MGSADSKESRLYALLGASSSKEGVLRAVNRAASAEKLAFFAELQDDVCGDPAWFSLLHADGAGTKAIVAYLAYRETGDASWIARLAQDSLAMNIDDVACVGAFSNLLLSNTIGRNRSLIPDDVIRAIIMEYREQAEQLSELGIKITLAGGETADMGDLVRTVVIDSTIFARVPKADAISTDTIADGDVLVGLSGTGTARYESAPQSSIGSNGFTLARHALIHRDYARRYPEIVDPALTSELSYRGQHLLFDAPAPLTTTIAAALLSPTRIYAPVLKEIYRELGREVHGVIHCTGGGQTKILRFGRGKKYVKDSLFPIPPVFELIQQALNVPWQEMYAVFNMGHRMELSVSPRHFLSIAQIAETFGIEAQIIGRVERSEHGSDNQLLLTTPQGIESYR